MALRLNRLVLGSYGDASNARRRLEELQGAFEGEHEEWEFIREGFTGEQVIWVYFPVNDPENDWSDNEVVFSFIRSKSIKYRKAIREAKAEKLAKAAARKK